MSRMDRDIRNSIILIGTGIFLIFLMLFASFLSEIGFFDYIQNGLFQR